jgi:hypothetical protein
MTQCEILTSFRSRFRSTGGSSNNISIIVKLDGCNWVGVDQLLFFSGRVIIGTSMTDMVVALSLRTSVNCTTRLYLKVNVLRSIIGAIPV